MFFYGFRFSIIKYSKFSCRCEGKTVKKCTHFIRHWQRRRRRQWRCRPIHETTKENWENHSLIHDFFFLSFPTGTGEWHSSFSMGSVYVVGHRKIYFTLVRIDCNEYKYRNTSSLPRSRWIYVYAVCASWVFAVQVIILFLWSSFGVVARLPACCGIFFNSLCVVYLRLVRFNFVHIIFTFIYTFNLFQSTWARVERFTLFLFLVLLLLVALSFVEKVFRWKKMFERFNFSSQWTHILKMCLYVIFSLDANTALFFVFSHYFAVSLFFYFICQHQHIRMSNTIVQ